jgi:hypothetical protein
MPDMNDNIVRNQDRGIPGNGGSFAPHDKPDADPAIVLASAGTVSVSQMAGGTTFTAPHPKTGGRRHYRKIWDEDRWLVEDTQSEECWRMLAFADATIEDVSPTPGAPRDEPAAPSAATAALSPEDAREAARIVDKLEAANKAWNEATNDGEEEEGRAYEAREDAELDFATEAHELLKRLLGR